MKKIIVFLIIILSGSMLLADEIIRCDTCGKIIEEAIYYQVDDKTHCQECYLQHVRILCDYCGLPIAGEYHIDFWGNQYHAQHADEAENCEFCNRLISEKMTGGGKKYFDGTIICNICSQTAIHEERKALEVMGPVVNELKWHGIRIETDKITLYLTDKNELAELAQNEAVLPEQKGLSIHHYTMNSDKEIVAQHFSIYALRGLPELHLIKVIAHELMHVWQFQNAIIKNDLALNEGSCNYAAYLVLQRLLKTPHYRHNALKKREIDYLLQTIEQNDDPIYGDGFRAVKKMVDRMGVSYWLRYLTKYDHLPQ